MLKYVKDNKHRQTSSHNASFSEPWMGNIKNKNCLSKELNFRCLHTNALPQNPAKLKDVQQFPTFLKNPQNKKLYNTLNYYNGKMNEQNDICYMMKTVVEKKLSKRNYVYFTKIRNAKQK